MNNRWLSLVTGQLQTSRGLPSLVWPLLIAIGVFVFLGGIYGRPVSTMYDVGAPGVSLEGVYPSERNDRFSYAYMRDTVVLTMPHIGVGTLETRLRLGGANASVPVRVRLVTSISQVHLGAVQALRTYNILLPTRQDGTAQLRIDSTTTQLEQDARPLGALLDTIHLRSFSGLSIPSSMLWGVPLTLALVWLITTQVAATQLVRLGLFSCAAAVVCLVYGLGRGRLALQSGWFIRLGLLGGALALVRLNWSQLSMRLRSAHWMATPLLMFVLTRLGIALIAYIATPIVIDPSQPPRPYFRPDNNLLDAFAGRWDTGFYLAIAEGGYRYEGVPLPYVAFFPLLPLLMRAFAPVVGDLLVTGLIVTNSALLCATLLFYRLVNDEWGNAVADRAVWYLLIFPMSFFGSAVYSDSLFLLGAIGALYYARKGRWFYACVLGILATLSRLVGIVVAPVLLVEWWMQRRRHSQQERPSLVALLAPAVVPIGTAAYMVYLQQAFGDPLAFVHASAAWGRLPRTPWAMLSEIVRRPAEGWKAALLAGTVPLDGWIDVGFLLLFIMLAGVLLYRRRWSEGLLMVLGILIPLNSGLLASQRRYMWVLFPGFILLARWGERPWLDRMITVFFLLGLGLFTALFVNWYWVA